VVKVIAFEEVKAMQRFVFALEAFGVDFVIWLVNFTKCAFPLSLCLAQLASGTTSAQERLPGDYMNEFWTGYETPHTPWAKPYALGKIKAFFIAPYSAAREVAELAQRLDLQVFGETTISESALGATDIYHAQVKGTSPQEKRMALLQKLEQRYDVIIVANFDFALLPIEVQYRIAEQVAEGTGLVFVYRHNPREGFFRNPDESGRNFVCSNIPFAGLSFYRDVFMQGAKSFSPDGISKRLVGTYKLRKGRVVQIDFGIRCSAGYGGFCLTPKEAFTFRSLAQYEYHQMLIINAILWAAKKEPPVLIDAPEEIAQSVAMEALPMKVSLKLQSQLETEAKAIVTIKNEWGEVEGESKFAVQIRQGENKLTLTVPRLTGGGHYIDVRITNPKGALCWASFWLHVLPKLKIAEVRMDKLSYERSEDATGFLQLSSPCRDDKWSLSVRLLDNYGRIYAIGRFPIKQGSSSVRFALPLDSAISMAGRCRVILMHGNDGIDQQEAEFVVPKRDIDVFPTLIWGTLPGILGHFLHEQIRKAGFNTILLPHYFCPWEESESGERRLIATVVRDDMFVVPYTTHISAWSGLGDDQTYQQRLEEFEKTAKFLAPYAPLLYSLGDENFIPEKAGFEPADRAGFIAFLKRKYGTLDALNNSWRTNLRSFDEASPISLPEARKLRRFAQYHDTETYREELYARWHRWLNDVYRRFDPYAKVGSEGSEPGDLEKTISGLGFWGPYREVVYQTLLRSLAPRSLVRGSWFGGYVFARRELGGLRRFVWDTLLDGSNLFEIFCCYTCETIFNTDLTFSYWAEAFLPDLKEIVDGIGQLLAASEHDNDPVAIYHSQASLHAANLHSPFGSRHSAHASALSLLSDSFLQPFYTTTNKVKAGALKTKGSPKVLLLICEQAISDEEAREIAEFVKRGGLLISDVAAAIMDGNCNLRSSGALDDVFGIKRSRNLISPQVGSLDLVLQKITVAGTGIAMPKLHLPNVTCDSAVQLATGVAIGKVGDAPAFIFNHYGKGAALLFNFPISTYQDLEREQKVAMLKLLSSLIRAFGVQPFCEVQLSDGIPAIGFRVSKFKRGNIVSIGILAHRPSPKAESIYAKVKFAKPMHIYDQRTGKYFGQTDLLSLTISPVTATMLSALPYKVKRLDVSVKPGTEIAAGSKLSLSISLRASDDAAPVGHIYRVRLTNPNGEDAWHYARTIKADVSSHKPVSVSIPFAYNEAIGKWTITVRDIATRIEKTISVTIKPSRSFGR